VALEDFIERVIAVVPRHELARARAEFDARTGPFEPGEPFYEERIRAFFDWLAIEWDGGSLLRRFSAQASASDRGLARALRASMRSLFRVHDAPGARSSIRHGPILECLLHGARFAIRRDETGAASRLRDGDLLDGRVVATEGGIVLTPGPIFHPRVAHEAIAHLLAAARAAGRCDGTLLDPLLRMRMRFDRFQSIHARHVYRFDAIDRVEILSAPWAAARG
jgi:hypothetical protein